MIATSAARVAVLLLISAVTAAAAPVPQPLWTADLSSHTRFDSDPEGIPSGVVFLSDDRLLAYVVEKPQTVALRPRGEYVGPDAPRLRTLLLDARTGRVLATHDLPATGYHVLRLMPNAAGGFLVRLQRSIVLYSPAFRPLAERPLPQRGPRDFWVAKVSSTGRTLWLYHDQTRTVERFDASTLQPLSACSGIIMTDFSSVSDQKFLTEARQSYVVHNASCDTAAFPKLLATGKRAPLECGMAHPFLGEGEIAMGGCGRITFASLLGPVIASDRFGAQNQLGLFPQVSRAQNTVAFWSYQRKGSFGSFFGSGGPAEVKSSALRVYDARRHQLAMVVPLASEKPRGFALSPDGTVLAVFRGTSVELFRLAAAPQ